MLKIITTPNPVLTAGTKKVERFDVLLSKLIKDMDQTLRAQKEPQGVGLAAPQVGANLAIFIVKPTPDAKTEAFINPRIVSIQTIDDRKLKIDQSSTLNPQPSKKKHTKLEGCLSIPKIWGNVDRADKVLLEYQDHTGKLNKKWFSRFKALIIQHEVDHLQGVLFTQRALEQKQQLFEEKDGELIKIKQI